MRYTITVRDKDNYKIYKNTVCSLKTALKKLKIWKWEDETATIEIKNNNYEVLSILNFN